MRADARHRVLEGEATEDTTEAISGDERPDPIDALRRRQAIAALPSTQRDPLLLAYYAALSQSEIAARLHVPLGTVKSRLAAAIRALACAVLPPEKKA